MHGLYTKLQTMMNTYQSTTYYEAVNMVISLEVKNRKHKEERRRLRLPLSLVMAKSARELFIIPKAMGASLHSHLFMVLFLPHSTDLGRRFTLGLLP